MIKARLILIIILLNFNVFAIDLVDNSFIDFVRFVSNSTTKNFIIDEDIDKKISIILPHDFNNKDSFNVLKSILKKKNMYIVKIGSTYFIRKYKKPTPPKEKFFSRKLVFLLPDKIIPIIKNYYPSLKISKSKKTLIYRCTSKQNKEILNLVSLLDTPLKSKKIKITLISYNDSDIYDYGLSLDINLRNDTSSIGYKTFLSNLVSSSSLILNMQNLDISAYISDLKSHELIDSKFSPTLSLFDNKNTNFSITQKIPYLNGSTSINGSNDIQNKSYSYNDVGSTISINKVSITDSEVYFHIEMKYEVILEKSLTPTTSKRYINNYLKLKDNESILIAGIKSDELSKLHREIPLLSGIPYLGNIFKWDSNYHKNQTFAIIISSLKYVESSHSLDVEKEAPRSGERGSASREQSDRLGYL